MRIVALALALGLTAGSCSRTSEPPPRSPAAEQTETDGPRSPAAAPNERGAPTPPELPQGAEPIVRLVDAGAAPRSLMRLRVPLGARQKAAMVMRMSMSMSLPTGDMSPMTALPPSKMVVETEVTEVTADGNIRYEFKLAAVEVLEPPGVDPSLAANLRASLQGLVGMKGVFVLTERGFMRSGDLELPASAPPLAQRLMTGMKTSLSQMVSPLPEEPVGAGAKWTVSATITQNGMTLAQTTKVQLLSRDAERAATRGTVVQTAAPQRLDLPGLPPGTTVDLVSLESTGEGEQRLELTKVMPVHAAVKVASLVEMSFRLREYQQEQWVALELEMEVSAQ